MIKLEHPEIKAAVVMKNGKILAKTESAEKLYPQYSITKSLLSLCIGILIDEGRISLESTVVDYIDLPKDAPLAQVTLEDLMTMRSGLTQELLFADRKSCPDYLAACLACEMGKGRFHYNNADAYLAGRMAETACGMRLSDFIEQRIFTPLGIRQFDFEYDPQGHFFGASGLMLSTLDLAKLGNSVLSGELYPKEFIHEATRPHTISDKGKGYGLFFWIHPDYFYMSGKWGQKCVMLPKSQRVICVNAEDQENRIVSGFIRNELMRIDGEDAHDI